MEDGLDIGLGQFRNAGRIFLDCVKQFIQFQIVIVKQAHNAIPLSHQNGADLMARL